MQRQKQPAKLLNAQGTHSFVISNKFHFVMLSRSEDTVLFVKWHFCRSEILR